MVDKKVVGEKPLFLKISNVIIKAIEIIIILFMISVIIINIVMSLNSNKNSRIQDFCGFKFIIITTDSMEPTLFQNDFIVIKQEDSYNEGDIVTYYKDGIFSTYRIEEKTSSDSYIVSADNKEDKIKEKINLDDIEGKYVYKFIAIGNILLILLNRLNVSIIIFVIIVIILIINRFKKLKFKKNEERNKKRLRYMINHK